MFSFRDLHAGWMSVLPCMSTMVGISYGTFKCIWEGQLIVDNCDPDKWSKVEVESICREFVGTLQWIGYGLKCLV